MGLQKYKRKRCHDDALLFSKQCVCIFVKYLQDGFTKIQTHAMTWRCVAFFGWVRLYLCKIFARWVYNNTNTRWHDQSTESPILDAPFWSENGVSCPCERNKIGDSVLWTWRCVALFSKQCVCIFVQYLQDGFTKIQTHAMTRRCVAFLPDGCVMTMRCFFSKQRYHHFDAISRESRYCPENSSYWRTNVSDHVTWS